MITCYLKYVVDPYKIDAFEEYREKSKTDAGCQQAFAFAEKTRCIRSHERSFMRPVFG